MTLSTLATPDARARGVRPAARPALRAASPSVFLLAPVALVAVPFMLVAFFGTASHEHQDAVVRRSLHPPAVLPALAH